MSAATSTRCEGCRGLLAPEDLFCACCGLRAPGRTESRPVTSTALLEFGCESCGASMSFHAGEGALACPFCDSTDLSAQEDARALTPDRVLRFSRSRGEAAAAMKKWLRSRFWSPSDLGEKARIESARAVYVPCWAFEADTHAHWAADSSKTPAGARSGWFPRTGEHRSSHRDVFVVASGALKRDEIDALSPYDLGEAVSPDPRAEGATEDEATVESFGFGRKYARVLARKKLTAAVHRDCADQVPGRSRNLSVALRIERMASEPVLLPVWMAAYRYQNEVYRLLVNGQTGQTTGRAPTSWIKVTMALLLLAGLIFMAYRMLGR